MCTITNNLVWLGLILLPIKLQVERLSNGIAQIHAPAIKQNNNNPNH